MRLLLLSNSGHPFLAHCRELIADFPGPIRTVGYAMDKARTHGH